MKPEAQVERAMQSRWILPPDEMLTRGVYLAPYLVKGFPALIGIDSCSWAIKHFVLRPATDEDRAWAMMEAWLDRMNPTLRLVKEFPPPPPRRAPRAPIPPHAYEDHVTFALRLARRFAQQHREYE
jgi:hypothetical protein